MPGRQRGFPERRVHCGPGEPSEDVHRAVDETLGRVAGQRGVQHLPHFLLAVRRNTQGASEGQDHDEAKDDRGEPIHRVEEVPLVFARDLEGAGRVTAGRGGRATRSRGSCGSASSQPSGPTSSPPSPPPSDGPFRSCSWSGPRRRPPTSSRAWRRATSTARWWRGRRAWATWFSPGGAAPRWSPRCGRWPTPSGLPCPRGRGQRGWARPIGAGSHVHTSAV
jgi:hypothetical protein